MNSYVNYIIEANIGLVLFMAAYLLILGRETDFSRQRLFLVTCVIASLAFPLIHLSLAQNSIPSLSRLLPSYMLPELIIRDQAGQLNTQPISGKFDFWLWSGLVYFTGVFFSLVLFLIRLFHLVKKMLSVSFSKVGAYKIIESPAHKHTFSFFNYIFIGQAHLLSADEKQRILQHETVHVRQLHSLDVMLLNVMGIFFWFNPVVKMYKKIFMQLHEFEADARAVGNRDVNDYCSLLAKVALQSADFRLANHFNNSLTLKRIKMMRTLKQKIKTWKMLAIASVIPMVFFILACQDQVMNDIAGIAKNSTHALVVPENIQARYETLKKENPNSNYIVVEFNEVAEKQLADMERKYGIPKHIELYTPDAPNEPIIGKSTSGAIITNPSLAPAQTFAIIEYNGLLADVGNLSKSEDDVFTIVEETAMPVGGMREFYDYLGRKIKYPADAKKSGIEGKVFVEFIIHTDGTLDVTGVSGIGAGCELEAMRVVQSSPKWTPGKNNGVAVKQRMVLPITFHIDGNNGRDEVNAPNPEGAMNEISVTTYAKTIK
jgi:TonB family protein